jgi:predicted nucleic acid-binding protein
VIVVDASVVVEVLLRTDRGVTLADRLFSGAETLHAPHLLDVEVTQVLRRYAARGDVTEQRAAESLALLAMMPVARYTHEPLLQRMWALRVNFTACDAAYVALAEGLGATLITCDHRLASAPGIATTVTLA